MNLAVLDRTIQALCSDIDSMKTPFPSWEDRSEDDLLFEAVLCMFSSQMVFEVAVAAVERLKARGLICGHIATRGLAEYADRVREAFHDPLHVQINGSARNVRPRFRNRLSMLLTETMRRIYGQATSLKEILRSARSGREAREALVEAVFGFGPKQASLYLRRIGYCADLAVLDTHVLAYLKLARGIEPKPGALARLSSYERIEAEFRHLAGRFGHAVGCVDLAMWITMRVAKREYAS